MSDFKMPAVEVGEIVHWYPAADRSASPHPAIVTRVGDQAIGVNVMGNTLRNFDLRNSVHHVDDPRLQNPNLRDLGAWDFTPKAKQTMKLLEDLKSLL